MRDADRERAWAKRNHRVGEFLEGLAFGKGVQGLDGGVLTRITIRMPTQEKPEALVVVKASTATGDMVAFVGARDVSEAVLAWRARDASTGLKWRVDRPYVKPAE